MATNSEETDLMIRHGEPYLKYRDKMGMFFPKGNTTSEFIKKAITPFKGFLNSDKEEDQ